ncbi:DUF6891 domain-containing protein [Nocardioides daphniae]|uniref:DUF6891 domain-containing protein n=1 Tax=Nocardioides daphniae TaxID=402297 RepID=A0ABQ1QG59_9ACTN|nr:hypothetical protein [Nocardioides daphniae]GGD26652.1 hypothetical protein GCM10007231_27580 [Nocardioides daphniae]
MAEERDEKELRETARLLVRSGLVEGPDLEETFTEMVRLQMPGTDAVIMSRAWLHAARREWQREVQGWTVPTDHDRLQSAFEECRSHAVAVLEGVGDLADVRRVVEASTPPLRGVVWFGRDEVFAALDRGVLTMGLRHGNGAPAAVAGDGLTTAVTGCLARHGLESRPVSGGVEVATWWQRRP